MPSCPCTAPLVPSRDRMKCITPCPWSLTFHTRLVCIPSLCPSLLHMVCHTWCPQFWACGPLLYGITVPSSFWLSFHSPSNCAESSLLILPASSGFWHFTGGKNKTKQNTFYNINYITCKIVGYPLFIFLGESIFKSTLLITMHTHAS